MAQASDEMRTKIGISLPQIGLSVQTEPSISQAAYEQMSLDCLSSPEAYEAVERYSRKSVDEREALLRSIEGTYAEYQTLMENQRDYSELTSNKHFTHRESDVKERAFGAAGATMLDLRRHFNDQMAGLYEEAALYYDALAAYCIARVKAPKLKIMGCSFDFQEGYIETRDREQRAVVFSSSQVRDELNSKRFKKKNQPEHTRLGTIAELTSLTMCLSLIYAY